MKKTLTFALLSFSTLALAACGEPVKHSGIFIKVISYQGKKLPVDQLEVRDAPKCPGKIYVTKALQATTLEGTPVKTPDTACGLGKVDSFTVREVEL